MCAHLVAPGLGVEGTYLPADHWAFSTTFRYYNSRQDVQGDEPLDHPLVDANTHVYAQDFNATRDSFPTVIVANVFGSKFQIKPYFKATTGAEKPPEVKF